MPPGSKHGRVPSRRRRVYALVTQPCKPIIGPAQIETTAPESGEAVASATCRIVIYTTYLRHLLELPKAGQMAYLLLRKALTSESNIEPLRGAAI